MIILHSIWKVGGSQIGVAPTHSFYLELFPLLLLIDRDTEGIWVRTFKRRAGIDFAGA